MSKILIINNCRECPFRGESGDTDFCWKIKRTNWNSALWCDAKTEIENDCPLPDFKPEFNEIIYKEKE